MLPRLTLPAVLGCFLAGGAAAQQCATGRTVLPERGAWTGRVVVGPDGVVVGASGSVPLPHGRITFHTGRSGSSVVVRRGGRGAWASPVPVAPACDPWSTAPRRVVVVRGGDDPCASPIPVCEPAPARQVNVLVGGPAACPPPRRETRVVVGNAFSPPATRVAPCDPAPACQEPVPWAEPAACPPAPCPTGTQPSATRGPADWTGQRRVVGRLPGPEAVRVDPLDPACGATTPPPAGLLADELILALASEDLARACLLARWLDGRPRYARQVELAFYARTPSPSLLREMARRLTRDCGDCPGRGSLVRLLGAEGSGAQ